MRTLVESFKRLYKAGRLTKEQMRVRVGNGLITEEEYEYIVGEPYEETTTEAATE